MGRWTVVSDAAVLGQLEQGIARSPGVAGWDQRLSYTTRVVGYGDGRVDLELSQGGVAVRTWIALPESGRPTPWLVDWEQAADAETWVQQLVDWLDEEMFTGGLGPFYARTTVDGVSRLTVEGYGFRLADDAKHRRLRRKVGPHGWHAGSRALAKKQYAAEWALDHVEQQLTSNGSRTLPRRPTSLEWSLRSPDRVAVHIEGSKRAEEADVVQLELVARAGLRRHLVGRRLITVAA